MQSRIRAVLVEYLAGLAGGLLLGGAAYLFGEIVLRRAAFGPWSAAFLSALSIALLTFGVVIGVGEPIYRLGRREHPEWGKRARTQLWKGAFLGSPTLIALLSLIEMDWKSIVGTGHPFLLVQLLLLLLAAIQYVATAPVRFFLWIGVPAEVLIILAMPIGAMLVRHFAQPESLLDDVAEATSSEDLGEHDSVTTGRS